MVSFKSTVSLVLATAATLASANKVTMQSKDGQGRTVKFYASVPHPGINSVQVPAGASVDVTFPDGWEGNWIAFADGTTADTGMLGEVKFQGWNGMTYFDVSAIVRPDDHNGVYKMWPVGEPDNNSGCVVFPCNNAYYLPDDIQTKTTYATDFICTLGGA